MAVIWNRHLVPALRAQFIPVGHTCLSDKKQYPLVAFDIRRYLDHHAGAVPSWDVGKIPARSRTEMLSSVGAVDILTERIRRTIRRHYGVGVRVTHTDQDKVASCNQASLRRARTAHPTAWLDRKGQNSVY